MIILILTKFIYLLRIQMKYSVNIFLKNVKKIDPENLKDLKAFIEYSSNMWMSMKILKSTMQTENIMY